MGCMRSSSTSCSPGIAMSCGYERDAVMRPVGGVVAPGIPTRRGDGGPPPKSEAAEEAEGGGGWVAAMAEARSRTELEPLGGSEASDEAESSCSSSTYDCATYFCARCSTEVDMIHRRSVEFSRFSDVCSAAARRRSRALSASRRQHAPTPTRARRRRAAARREEAGEKRATSARPRLLTARARVYWPWRGWLSRRWPIARNCALSCPSVSEKRCSSEAIPPASSDALTVGFRKPLARSTASCSRAPASRVLPRAGVSCRSSRSTNWCSTASMVPTV